MTTNSSSSAGSGAVSVISTEEYGGSHFSNPSISPENCALPTYPTDGYDPDYPLVYPPGFYDQNGYFYRKFLVCPVKLF